MKIKILRLIFFPLFFIPLKSSYYASQDYENKDQIFLLQNKIEASPLSEKNELIITFDNLKSLLLKNNKQLQKYRSQVEQNKLILNSKIAKWSPRVSISSASLPSYSNGYANNKLKSDTETKQLKVGLDSSIEWDIIEPKRRLEIKIARDKVQNSNFQYDSLFKSLYFDVLNNFYTIQALNEEKNVAKKAIEISKLAVQDAENRFKQGIGNKLDVLEAQTQLHRDEINLLKREKNFKLNKNLLAENLNIDKEFRIQDHDSNLISFIWDIDKKNAYSSLLENNEEILIGKRNIEINNKEALVILSEKKPKFTLYNKYSFSSSEGEAGSTSLNKDNQINDVNNTVGLRLNWNLFDGGVIRQNYLARKNRNFELQYDLDLKKKQLFREINDTYDEYTSIQEKIILSYQQLQSAKESLFISMKRMEAGITTQREVVNTQGDVIEAETNFINSLKKYKIILATFNKITNISPSPICSYKVLNKKDINSRFKKFLSKNNLIKNCI